MKFTRILAREKIAAILKLNGQTQQMSDRTLDAALDTLMPFAGEETELDAFVAQISGTFTSMDGNLRNESSERATAFNLANPKVPTAEEVAAKKVVTDAKEKEEAKIPAYMKTFMDGMNTKFTEMDAKFTGAETAKTQAQQRETILANSKGKYTEVVIKNASRNFDFTKETSEADFNATCNSIGADFGVTPPVAGADNVQKPNYGTEIKRLQSEGRLPQPTN